MDVNVPGESKVGYAADLHTNNKNKLGTDADAEVPGVVKVGYITDLCTKKYGMDVDVPGNSKVTGRMLMLKSLVSSKLVI